jgi:arylsulfatase A-like enzyme
MTRVNPSRRVFWKEVSLLIILVVAFTKAFAQGCFDPFADASTNGGTSYAVGSYLMGQGNGFANGSNTWYGLTNTPAPPATGFPTIAAGNLVYPNWPVSAGNCVSIPSAVGVMGRMTLNFQVTSGTAYFAFLLNVQDLSQIDTTGTQDNFFAAFGDTTGNQNSVLLRGVTKIYTKKSGAGFKLGVARNTAVSGNWVFDTTQRNTNQVLFIVGSYDYTAHTANLWINPATNTWGAATPPAATISAAKGSDLNANGIQAFVLGCRTNPPPGCLVDDLRIGTNWAMVTGGLSIVAQPVGQTLNAGTSGTFSVSASGAPPLAYQWRKNGAPLSNGAKYSGTTGAALTVNNLVAADDGSYSVIITNSTGAITSSVALLAVLDPAINTQPVAQTLVAGTNAVFQVNAAGSGTLTYQWYKNGTSLVDGGNISGATTASLTISDISVGDEAGYYVVVGNGLNGSVQSATENLFLADPTLPGGRPNIIYILADDLGYGDSGILFQNGRAPGLPKESTPNLDTLAAEGMQLRQHYCPAPVCAPSRASLLLGVHQGHANVRDQQYDKALSDNYTLANVLQAAGYATAIVGKWGLGGDDEGGTTPAQWPAFPTKRGFDYFFGYERHADGHEHYPKEAVYSARSKECYDMSNNITATLDKCYTCDLFTARAKKWITDQRAAQPGQPFFLYLAFDTPHSVYELPTQAYPAGGGTNGGMQWTGAIGHMINTASGTVDSYVYPDYASATYDDDGNPATPEVAWPEVFQRYASSVRRIDDAVGDVRQLLKDLNIDSNTMVIFTSDNGPTTEDELNLPVTYAANFFDTFGPMDGVKRDTWEGGIRMPTFVRWPGKIAPGTLSETPSQFHDWMPTFTALAGLPGPARTDGVSLLPTLLSYGTQQQSTIYVEYFDDDTATPEYPEFVPAHQGRARNQMQVVGLNGYQGVRYNIQAQSNDFEIYDVSHDLHEATNLATEPGFAALQQAMKDRVLQLRRPDPHAPRPYDNEWVPALGPIATTAGALTYSAYEGDWPWVPDTAMLTAKAAGQCAGLDLSVRTRDTNYAIYYDGYIRVRQDGNYTFYLNDDSGAELRIHEATVIDDDYGHVNLETNGSILLAAGLHPIHLTYRHTTGTNALTLKYSGPGITKQSVPPSAFEIGCSNCPINPEANDDNATTTAGTPVTIAVLTNDIDAAPLSVVSNTAPQAGNAVLVNNQFIYTPNANFLGDDQFAYTISDGAAQATATVRISVCFSNGNYWFPFNETGGFVTTEAGGLTTAQLHQYTNDPAEWVPGRYNEALSFDGISNYVTIDGFDGILGAAPRTCAAWIQTTGTTAMGIMGWGVDATGNKWSVLVEGGNLRVEITGGWAQGSRVINDGQWHHVACVLPPGAAPDATNILLYVDGTADSLSSISSTPVNTADAGEAAIGTEAQGRLFNGVIDEVHIYNSALSATQVSSLYNATNQSADAWAWRYFGAAAVNWNADADGDGASLWTEYAFGGQPWIADSGTLDIVPEIISGQLKLVYNRRIPGTDELVYQVQYSPDLKHWGAVSGTEDSVTPSGALPGFEQVVFTPSLTLSNGTPVFLRVSVQVP